MKRNPFKFGTIVDGPHFINRHSETEELSSLLNSENHVILSAPRRYGKSSLINKVVQNLDRPVIVLDLQLINSPTELAGQLLKRAFKIFPGQKMRMTLKNFRIIPTITINPVTNVPEVSFHPSNDYLPVLEDAMNLVEKLSSEKNKTIVVFDEFQEVERIDNSLIRQLRSIMQYHRKINYVLTGSQESIVREIFEKRKSPFYNFGMVLQLQKIPEKEFISFIEEGLSVHCKDPFTVAEKIISVTGCHPFYTQLLAFVVWERVSGTKKVIDVVNESVQHLIRMNDMSYERIWSGFNKTDRKLLSGLATSHLQPLSEEFRLKFELGATSTTFSSLKRLLINGYITKTESTYEIDDPFFSLWLKQRLETD